METNKELNKLSIEIAPTTGGAFDFLVDPEDSIDFIKKCIAKKLKVGKEQICLLHRDRLLENCKTVKDYGLADGSRVSLVPSIETGLVTQRPEQSVLEALEGLNESQVGDFLSGKSPLNLTMRLGDHVMLIQLQLSKGQHHHATTSSINHDKSSETPPPSETATPTTITPPTVTPPPPSDPPPPPPPPTPPPTQPTPPTQSLPTPQPSSSSLVEASRNLTNTLKKLSSHVTTSDKKKTNRKRRRSEESTNQKAPNNKEEKLPITNHMQHHGKGVYSGTFSGTLNPALQDGLGKPKKHVSTIVHILNDLLGGVQAGATTSSSSKKKKKHHSTSTTTPSSTITSEPTEEERALENEALRVKMEALREQLRLRKGKFNKSGGSSGSGAGGGSGSGLAGSDDLNVNS